jgi:hypothetical protein
MEDSGYWEVGTITENKDWDLLNCCNLAIVNEGTAKSTVHEYPINPGGTFPVTTGTTIKNPTPIKVKFIGPGTKLLRYSFFRKNPCNNE